MKLKPTLHSVLHSVFSFALVFVLITGVGPGLARGVSAQPAAPATPLTTAFTYQGQLSQDGAPYSGSCDLRFNLYADAGGATYVAGPVDRAIPSITNGLVTTSLDFGLNPFQGQQRWLKVEVRCPSGPGAYTSMGLQELTAAPYALFAASAPWSGLLNRPTGLDDGDDDTQYFAGDGLFLWGTTFYAQGSAWDNVIIVAQSGGDYTSVDQALTGITDAGPQNPYLVFVAPGIYTETVSMTVPNFVHLMGAGEGATILSSNMDFQATLQLGSHSTVRSLTVRATGMSSDHPAIYAPVGTMDSWLIQVTALADGSGTLNRAIAVDGINTEIDLLHVTAEATGATTANYSLTVTNQALARLQGGLYYSHHGRNNIGIYLAGTKSKLEAQDATAMTEFGDINRALILEPSTKANLVGGRYSAQTGGYESTSIYSDNGDLFTENVELTAGMGHIFTVGLYQLGSLAMATMRNSSSTATGGGQARGVYLDDGTFYGENLRVTATMGVTNTIGLYHAMGQATLVGGEYQASIGPDVFAIQTLGELEARQVVAMADGALRDSFGLKSEMSAGVRLIEGSFSAKNGDRAAGIWSEGMLEARDVTALAQDGQQNYGLQVGSMLFGPIVRVWGGSYSARGGMSAWGIFVQNAAYFSGQDFSALGENAANNVGFELFMGPADLSGSVLEGMSNSVVVNPAGLLTISNARLIGGPVGGPGVVTCVLVSRGNLVVVAPPAVPPCP